MAIKDNLIAFWELEANGNDSHGLNNLTNGGTVTFVSGKVGNGANFVSTSSQKLSITDNIDLSTGDVDFYINLWTKIPTASIGNWQAFMTRLTADGVTGEFHLSWTGSILRFQIRNAGVAVGTAEWGSGLSGDTWYNIGAWHDSVNNLVGVQLNNGTPVTSATTGAPADTGVDTRLGAFYNDAPFMDGMLDQVGFWKGRMLTADERTWLYNSGNGRTYAEMAPSTNLMAQICL